MKHSIHKAHKLKECSKTAFRLPYLKSRTFLIPPFLGTIPICFSLNTLNGIFCLKGTRLKTFFENEVTGCVGTDVDDIS